MMEFAEFDQHNKVLCFRFSGELTAGDINAAQRFAAAFVAAEGPVRTMFDFTKVERVDFPDQGFGTVHQAHRRVMPGQRRVLVAPQPAIAGICRKYGEWQCSLGYDMPDIVASEAEALQRLDIREPPRFKRLTIVAG